MSKYDETIAALRDLGGPTPPRIIERAAWQIEELETRLSEMLSTLQLIRYGRKHGTDEVSDADLDAIIARVKASQ
jgi:hypothetical protein